jgi:adenosylhomocysteine nucleosidase
MNKIAVICAMQVELDAIKKLLSNLEEITIGPRTFYKGIFEDKEIVIVKCGIGKVNAAITTTLLINEFKPSLIINCGVAGGYSSKLKPLDVVIGNNIFFHSLSALYK